MSLRANPSSAHLFLCPATLDYSVANVSPALPCLRAAARPPASPLPVPSVLFRCRSSQCRSHAYHFPAFPTPFHADRRTALPTRSTSGLFPCQSTLFKSSHLRCGTARICRFSSHHFTVLFLSLAIANAAIPSPCLLPLRFSAAAPYAASPSHAIPTPFPPGLNYSHAVLQLAFPLPMSCIAMRIVSYAAFFYSAASMT